MKNVIITGKMKIGRDSITVYSNGLIYGLSRYSSDWGSNRIGGYAPGGKITAELYQQWENECDEIGTFVLTPDGWDSLPTIYLDPNKFKGSDGYPDFWEGYQLEPVKGSKNLFIRKWINRFEDGSIESAIGPSLPITTFGNILKDVAERGYIKYK